MRGLQFAFAAARSGATAMHNLNSQSASTCLSWTDGAGKMAHAAFEREGRRFDAQVLRADATNWICLLLEESAGGKEADSVHHFTGSAESLAAAKDMVEAAVRTVLRGNVVSIARGLDCDVQGHYPLS